MLLVLVRCCRIIVDGRATAGESVTAPRSVPMICGVVALIHIPQRPSSLVSLPWDVAPQHIEFLRARYCWWAHHRSRRGPFRRTRRNRTAPTSSLSTAPYPHFKNLNARRRELASDVLLVSMRARVRLHGMDWRRAAFALTSTSFPAASSTSTQCAERWRATRTSLCVRCRSRVGVGDQCRGRIAGLPCLDATDQELGSWGIASRVHAGGIDGKGDVLSVVPDPSYRPSVLFGCVRRPRNVPLVACRRCPPSLSWRFGVLVTVEERGEGSTNGRRGGGLRRSGRHVSRPTVSTPSESSFVSAERLWRAPNVLTRRIESRQAEHSGRALYVVPACSPCATLEAWMVDGELGDEARRICASSLLKE